MNGTDICFRRSDLSLYMFLLLCLIIYLIYIAIKTNESMSNTNLNRGLTQKDLQNKITVLNDELYNCKIEKQNCNRNLQQLSNNNTQQKFIDKIYNPLAPPENVYGGGRLNQRGYDSYQQFQMIGYLSGNGQQYPVFARDKYPGRTDKQEYYTINDSRNRVKIPFKTQNWNELYSGDTIDIPEIASGLVFTKYDTNTLRYDPNYF
jgi:hypothetical protein